MERNLDADCWNIHVTDLHLMPRLVTDGSLVTINIHTILEYMVISAFNHWSYIGSLSLAIVGEMVDLLTTASFYCTVDVGWTQ